jgi:hypothetical protein
MKLPSFAMIGMTSVVSAECDIMRSKRTLKSAKKDCLNVRTTKESNLG